jgi:hypothetical protein
VRSRKVAITSTITYIDSPQARLRQRDLAVALLIEELHHPDHYDRAAEIMVDLAPVEAILVPSN